MQKEAYTTNLELKLSSFGAGRVAEAVECLPSKCEALSSNPSTTKKLKKPQLF
jgi:hypothetical protein